MTRGILGPDAAEYYYPDSRGAAVSSTVEFYDPNGAPVTHWTPTASMTFKRIGLAAAKDRWGRIYAIGGETNTVERYDPEEPSPKWRQVASMTNSRAKFAATTDESGSIYVLGGDADPKNPTVEVYTPPDPGTGAARNDSGNLSKPGTWSTAKIPPLPEGRARNRFGAAAAQGPGPGGRVSLRLYIFGGCCEAGDPGFRKALNFVDSIDPAQPSAGWEAMTPMPSARLNVPVVRGIGSAPLLYAMGGDEGEYGLPSPRLQSYDPAADASPPFPAATIPGASTSVQVVHVKVAPYGPGTGTVVSDDGKLSCPPICEHDYVVRDKITFTAKAASGSGFATWDDRFYVADRCSGTQPTCSVTLDGSENDTPFDVYGTALVTPLFSGCSATPPNEFCVPGDKDALGSFDTYLPFGPDGVPAPRNAVVDKSGSVWFTYSKGFDNGYGPD
ncbi:MAG: hypothetical protein LC749_07985, partial [Actinobacteria bacterium]|nr:hypothetical protein [Actinomycetota bacterium]